MGPWFVKEEEFLCNITRFFVHCIVCILGHAWWLVEIFWLHIIAWPNFSLLENFYYRKKQVWCTTKFVPGIIRVCGGSSIVHIIWRIPWLHWTAFNFIATVNNWRYKLSCYHFLHRVCKKPLYQTGWQYKVKMNNCCPFLAPSRAHK